MKALISCQGCRLHPNVRVRLSVPETGIIQKMSLAISFLLLKFVEGSGSGCECLNAFSSFHRSLCIDKCQLSPLKEICAKKNTLRLGLFFTFLNL